MKLTLAVAPPARRPHGRQKVSIPECDPTGRRSTIILLPVRLHSGTRKVVSHYILAAQAGGVAWHRACGGGLGGKGC